MAWSELNGAPNKDVLGWKASLRASNSESRTSHPLDLTAWAFITHSAESDVEVDKKEAHSECDGGVNDDEKGEGTLGKSFSTK